MLSQPCSALCISLFLPLEDLTDRCQCTEHFGRIQKYIQDFLVFDSSSNGGETSAWPKLLAAAYPALCSCSLVEMLTWIVERAIVATEEGTAYLDFVEYACGRGNLSKAMLRKNYSGVGLLTLCGTPCAIACKHQDWCYGWNASRLCGQTLWYGLAPNAVPG